MEKKKISFAFTLLVFLFATKIFAQGEANFWYFGDHCGLDFNGGSPVPLGDGALFSWEGCSAISTISGALLFYTNGVTVWNKQHRPMANGGNILGTYLLGGGTQSALIVPKPGSSNIYYVFTTPNIAGIDSTLRYSEIDLTLARGLGDVTTNKNIPLASPVNGKLTAVKKANNVDYWVIAHELLSNEFLVYSVTSAGVDPFPVKSNAGSIDSLPLGYTGYLKASVDGNMLAQALQAKGVVDVLNFNTTTGLVSSNFSISLIPNAPYGVEFSPDRSRLYLGKGDKIIQYDLTFGTPAAIIASTTVIGTVSNIQMVGALQLGPDKKIYVSYLGSYLGCINKPNAPGTACAWVYEAIIAGTAMLGSPSYFGLPNIISSYFFSCSNYKITVNDVSICAGETAHLTAKGADSYSWSAGLISTGRNTAKDSPLISTNYTVTGTNPPNCIDTATVAVVVNALPTTNTIPNITISLGESATIAVIALGAEPFGYQWMPLDGLNQTNQATVRANPEETTKYYVSITDKNGCRQTDSLIITVNPKCLDFFIPDAFSPNGDAINEIFMVRANTSCVKNFDLTIFDRWGQKVFETTDITKGWDGTFSPSGEPALSLSKGGKTFSPSGGGRGEELNPGVYFYFANIVFSNGLEPVIKKGNVSLVR